MEIISLFPTVVAKVSIDRPLTDIESATALSMQTRANEGNKTSVNYDVLSMPEFSSIKQFVDQNIKEYFDKIISPVDNIKPYITQSWLNYTSIGEYHHKHCHTNSILSGVFYITANQEHDKIYFHKEMYQTIDIIPKEYNIYNSPTWWVPVNQGDLVLFPSRLMHQVANITTDTVRISLAFNVFIKGSIGRGQDLNLLSL
jgi:uncharacterized protein (TIGR02466 family)